MLEESSHRTAVGRSGGIPLAVPQEPLESVEYEQVLPLEAFPIACEPRKAAVGLASQVEKCAVEPCYPIIRVIRAPEEDAVEAEVPSVALHLVEQLEHAPALATAAGSVHDYDAGFLDESADALEIRVRAVRREVVLFAIRDRVVTIGMRRVGRHRDTPNGGLRNELLAKRQPTLAQLPQLAAKRAAALLRRWRFASAPCRPIKRNAVHAEAAEEPIIVVRRRGIAARLFHQREEASPARCLTHRIRRIQDAEGLQQVGVAHPESHEEDGIRSEENLEVLAKRARLQIVA